MIPRLVPFIDPLYCPAGVSRGYDPDPSGEGFVVHNITLNVGNVGKLVTENELHPDPCQALRALYNKH